MIGGVTTGMRDALLALLKGEPAGRRVWTADLTYWMAGEKQRGRGDGAWDTAEGYLALHRDLGVMPYYDYTRFWAARAVYDATVSETWEQDGARSVHRIRTPKGEVREEHLQLPESACSGCTRHFIQDERDLDVLAYLLEHRRLEPENLDDYYERFRAWSAYDGIPCLGLPRSPLASFCYEWAGIENAVYLLLDQEETVRRVLGLMEAQEAPIVDAVCRLKPPLVHFPDNLDSENLTSLYDEHLGPTHRRRLERLHDAGIAAAVHLDGAVRGLLPKLAAAGFDAVEALTPKPAGDIGVAEMRDLVAGTKTVLWGGVPGAMFAPPYTWADMERHVERVLAEWRGRPFVLGVADQIPPDGDVSFCRKIAEMIR